MNASSTAGSRWRTLPRPGRAAACRHQAADWARRRGEHREQEWAVAQELLAAVRCFLESFGDREVAKMTLAQVSHAFQISPRIGRQALSGAAGPDEPALAPLQVELAAALNWAYAQPPPGEPGAPLPYP